MCGYGKRFEKHGSIGSMTVWVGLAYCGEMQQVISQLIFDFSEQADNGTARSAPLLEHVHH